MSLFVASCRFLSHQTLQSKNTQTTQPISSNSSSKGICGIFQTGSNIFLKFLLNEINFKPLALEFWLLASNKSYNPYLPLLLPKDFMLPSINFIISSFLSILSMEKPVITFFNFFPSACKST